jgi:hypothetical protein
MIFRVTEYSNFDGGKTILKSRKVRGDDWIEALQKAGVDLSSGRIVEVEEIERPISRPPVAVVRRDGGG